VFVREQAGLGRLIALGIKERAGDVAREQITPWQPWWESRPRRRTTFDRFNDPARATRYYCAVITRGGIFFQP
jgi:hypothetical protein